MTSPPYILFLPVSGPTGFGEYGRCRTLADELHRQLPELRIKFALDCRAPYFDDVRFETQGLEGSATFNTPAITQLMRSERPDLVIFDNAGRLAQLKCARELGARTVFLATRPRKISKAHSLRWSSRLDQVWVVQPRLLVGRPGPWQRIRRRFFGGAEVLNMPTLFPATQPERRAALRAELGIGDRPYVLFMPGGGGGSADGRPSAELFAEAAGRVARGREPAVIAVMGPLYGGALPEIPGVIVRRAVSAEQAVDLLADARVAVVGGGATVVQALALGRAVVAVATGGSDQPRRIRSLGRSGLIEVADREVDAMARATVALLDDPRRLETLQSRAASCGLQNGLQRAVAAVRALLDQR